MDRRRFRLCALLEAWLVLLYVHMCWVVAVLSLLCVLYEMERRDRRRRISLDDRTFVRSQVRNEEIDRIIRSSDRYCVWELRMDKNAFALLCEMLKTQGGLIDDGHVTLEEQVAIFVNILAHQNKNRNMQVRFFRSGETISRYVHRVLSAVIRLQYILYARPKPVPDNLTSAIGMDVEIAETKRKLSGELVALGFDRREVVKAVLKLGKRTDLLEIWSGMEDEMKKEMIMELLSE